MNPIPLRLSLPLLALLLALLLAGCASTPDSRIHRNPEIFDALPVAAQARIRGGQIDLGFSPEMVRLAFGEPHRVLTRTSPAGTSDVWLYLDLVRRYERQRVDIDGLTISGPGSMRSVGGSAWINVVQEREYVRIRVEFQNGSVVAFEQPAKETSKP
jgi:hypothetical protein